MAHSPERRTLYGGYVLLHECDSEMPAEAPARWDGQALARGTSCHYSGRLMRHIWSVLGSQQELLSPFGAPMIID